MTEIGEIMPDTHEYYQPPTAQETVVVHDLDDTHIKSNKLTQETLTALTRLGYIDEAEANSIATMLAETRGGAVDPFRFISEQTGSAELMAFTAKDWVDLLANPSPDETYEQRREKLRKLIVVEGSVELIQELNQANYNQMFLTYGSEMGQTIKLDLHEYLTVVRLPLRILRNHEKDGLPPDIEEKSRALEAVFDEGDGKFDMEQLLGQDFADQPIRYAIILDDKPKNIPSSKSSDEADAGYRSPKLKQALQGVLVSFDETKHPEGKTLGHIRQMVKDYVAPFDTVRSSKVEH